MKPRNLSLSASETRKDVWSVKYDLCDLVHGKYANIFIVTLICAVVNKWQTTGTGF